MAKRNSVRSTGEPYMFRLLYGQWVKVGRQHSLRGRGFAALARWDKAVQVPVPVPV